MSEKIRELKEKRMELFQKARVLDTSTPEKVQEANKMLDDINTIDAAIETEGRMAKLAGTLDEQETRERIVHDTRRHTTKEAITDREKKLAFRAWCAGDKEDLVSDEMRRAMKKCGVKPQSRYFSMAAENRAATSGGLGWGAGSTGANLAVSSGELGPIVPNIGIGLEIEKFMNAYGGAREACRVIKTQTGANFMYPVFDESTVLGALVAENAQTTVHAFGSTYVEFKAHKFTSRIVKVSLETLMDTVYPFEAILSEMLGERIARSQNYYFTIGASSDGAQPDGVVGGSTAAATSKVSGFAANCGTAFATSDLLALFHAVDPYYRKNGTWMFNDNTLLAIKAATLLSTFYYPVWQPSLTASEPDTILGRPYIINQSFESFQSTSGHKPIAFGDFSKHIIRDVMGVQLVRFNEMYMDYYEQGFAAFARADSHCVNAQALKHLATST